MIGQTFTLTGRPKLVFRLVWRGSINGIDCVRGVALNGKLQTLRRGASYRRALFCVDRARLARRKATVAAIINLGAAQQAAQRVALMGAPMGTA
jgi:hypothetical protein